MNEKIRSHVAAYNASKGWGQTDEDLIGTITDRGKLVWTGIQSRRRWWTDVFIVVDVGGMLIGFDGAVTTGDDSAEDKGWEFNPDSICEVFAEEVTSVVYKRSSESSDEQQN